MNNAVQVCPRFLDSRSGRLFLVEFAANSADGDKEPVIIVPPFGEEMNRCRRMSALQGSALASAGHRTIMFDLYGTGDSEGEFVDADWETWQRNVADVIEWTTGEDRRGFSLLAIRLGALLAMSLDGDTLGRARRLIFWHPVSGGRMFLRQFLRMRIAANLGTELEGSESIKSIMADLERGGTVEIGGYELTASLASAIDGATLDIEAGGPVPPVYWFDMSAVAAESLSPATGKLIEQLAGKGIAVNANAIEGESFWSTVEVTTAPGLLAATSAVFAN